MITKQLVALATAKAACRARPVRVPVTAVTTADPVDTITMDVPFLMRLLEQVREEVKDDSALHQLTEALIKIHKTRANGGTLSMDDFTAVLNESGAVFTITSHADNGA